LSVASTFFSAVCESDTQFDPHERDQDFSALFSDALYTRAMLVIDETKSAVPLTLVAESDFKHWRKNQSKTANAWIARSDFIAKGGQFIWLPNDSGEPSMVAVGIGDKPGLDTLGSLPYRLAVEDYRLETDLPTTERYRVLLGWGLGAYRFTRYKSADRAPARLLISTTDESVLEEQSAIGLCRDLVNTPANDMLPHDLEKAATSLAEEFDAQIAATTGDALLHANLNMIHAVGRASASAPRLIDIRWGNAENPKVTIVGKGVCFDSGGLDLKTAAGMRMMKKDMGGGAHALGLAKLIMARQLPVLLRVLVPAVENAVSANSFRPGDVLHSYQGTSIEIDNTDAEGRLILCDALALAAEDNPKLIVDFATLTGAARVALGTELPAMFANDEHVATGIITAGLANDDEVWRLPLHAPYRALLKSKVADISNIGTSPYGGAITAALFLEQFVGNTPWVHFDIMAWNQRSRPAHPEGGEAMGLRAVYGYLENRFVQTQQH
jgi:leucyl aminopeptidase